MSNSHAERERQRACVCAYVCECVCVPAFVCCVFCAFVSCHVATGICANIGRASSPAPARLPDLAVRSLCCSSGCCCCCCQEVVKLPKTAAAPVDSYMTDTRQKRVKGGEWQVLRHARQSAMWLITFESQVISVITKAMYAGGKKAARAGCQGAGAGQAKPLATRGRCLTAKCPAAGRKKCVHALKKYSAWEQRCHVGRSKTALKACRRDSGSEHTLPLYRVSALGFLARQPRRTINMAQQQQQLQHEQDKGLHEN